MRSLAAEVCSAANRRDAPLAAVAEPRRRIGLNRGERSATALLLTDQRIRQRRIPFADRIEIGQDFARCLMKARRGEEVATELANKNCNGHTCDVASPCARVACGCRPFGAGNGINV